MRRIASPSWLTAVLSAWVLCAASTAADGADRPRILFLGDSNLTSRPEVRQHFAERLGLKLEKVHLPAVLMVDAQPARNTARTLQSLEARALNRVPTHVVLQIGTVEGLADPNTLQLRFPVEGFRARVANIARRIQAGGSKLVLMTPIPLFWNDRLVERYAGGPYDVSDRWGLNLHIEEFAEAIRSVGEELDAPVVDLIALYRKYEKDDPSGRTKVDFDWSITGTLANDDAHEAIALALARTLVPMLRAEAKRDPAPRPRPQLTGQPRVTFVEAGRALGLRTTGDGWQFGDRGAVGTAGASPAYLAHGIVGGDFQLHLRIAAKKPERASRIELGPWRFAWGAGSNAGLALTDPDGRTAVYEPATRYVAPEVAFDLVVERIDGRATISIDGTRVLAFDAPGEWSRIGVVPGEGEVRVEHATLRGATTDLGSTLPPAYTIPTIDLAGETDRQTIVDREPGQYLGHPTTVLLEDGKTMLTVYPKGHGRGAIVMKRSEDGGRTWSERLPVPDNWATSLETPSIHRVIAPDGTRRLIVFSGLYPARRAVSEDDGRTWTPLEPVGGWGGIVVMGSMERRSDGSYLAWFHDDGRYLRGTGERGPFRVYQTISTDGGLTWSEPTAIAQHARAHLCEPGVVRSPDGKQWALLLRENSRRYNSFVIFSDDEGATWSAPRELPASLTGDRHTARYAPDGRLLISFRDTTRESSTRGDWVAWVGHYRDIVAGTEGHYRVRLMDNHVRADCAYPGVEVLPDGTFVLTTYGHWTPDEKPYIVSIRLTLDELDARQKQ
ncbi:MAG: exo-alpha-sialidase [Planctomycetota bacterium]